MAWWANKWIFLIGLIALIWIMGGQSFIMRNPMVIVFGLLIMAVMAFTGKK